MLGGEFHKLFPLSSSERARCYAKSPGACLDDSLKCAIGIVGIFYHLKLKFDPQ